MHPIGLKSLPPQKLWVVMQLLGDSPLSLILWGGAQKCFALGTIAPNGVPEGVIQKTEVE